MNRVWLIGRVTRDIELRTTAQGMSVASFTLAVDRMKDKNGNKKTDFINCVAWQKSAETLAKYTQKGHKIAVEGRIQSRQYDAKDGTKKTAIDVIIAGFEFCERKQENHANDFVVNEEEIPF